MAAVNIVRVYYKGAAPALNGLLGGEAQLMFANVAAALPHVKAGKLKALATTGAEPSALFPALRTIATSGVPSYESVALFGIFVPAKTPAGIVRRLNQEIVLVLNDPDVKGKFLNSGAEVIAGSPAELMRTMKAEMVRIGKVIREAGIRDE